ncbi:MAG: non-reducing end alpha-L-arabinofuranosidase family hydrolase [Brevundimonas sp.]|uniref:non-reducing end alpha-L-arabinofuranosidase family hydrolase n=1 Tax=Brevundimonas sp. TaxID=1871086 RepID=UPI002716C03D|nr:non-reducing end alpha-L-arabinofuranosidase family hydrolase [Brevundimonas sp.]MDO9607675.1 non-reducing end alpha-L-arabinofuranosidase family hydrolase [Brevundimonas sp.]
MIFPILTRGRRAGALAAAIALIGAVGPATAGAAEPAKSPTQFHWRSSAQLISPHAEDGNGYSALKDPSIVYVDGEYHVFMTSVGAEGWHMAYTHFTDWSQASAAPIVDLKQSGIGPGYRAAPQVFYFAPHKLWYMVYQSGPPVYSTTATLGDPSSWTAPKPFFDQTPDLIKAATGEEAWLDFWVICDETSCYLFNTDDHGNLFRSRTSIQQFPAGFSDTQRVMSGPRDDIFEASLHYRLAGTNTYLTLIEAIGPQGRYFRAWTSDRLDGDWTLLAGSPSDSFAGSDNVVFDGPAWSQGVSHGELVRSGYDQTLTLDPCRPLQFLYQGLEPHAPDTAYIDLPYRLGLLTATGPNPVSALCPTSK